MWGVEDLAASLLEAFGPLTVLGAQVVYLCQPFFMQSPSGQHLDALAHMLEDSTQTQAFALFLREGTQQ